MRRLRIGDKVKIIAGKDKGKTGVVEAFVKGGDYVIVKGVNLVTKFIKKGLLGENQAGGKIKIEAPLHRSNLMVICKVCGKPTRISIKEVDGKRFRVCRKCGAFIDKTESIKEAKERVSKVVDRGKVAADAEANEAKVKENAKI